MTKLALELLGITRCFQPYSHEQRANHASSHRMGYLQRQQVGEYFWISEHVPGIAFSTRGAAVDAARKALGLD